MRRAVVVIGAGIAGLTLAYELSKRHQIFLFEEGQRPQGASSLPFALLNPYRGGTARATPSDLAGLAAMRRLKTDLERQGYPSGVHFSGVLRIASSQKQATKWQKLHPQLPYVGQADLAPSYHAPFGALWLEQGAWVEPDVLLDSLLKAAQARGLTYFPNTKVTGFQLHPPRVLFAQASMPCDSICFCIGAQPFPSLESYVPIPLSLHAGEVVELASEVDMPQAIAGAVYGGRRGESLYFGGNHRPPDVADPSAPERLQRAVSWFVPELKTARRLSVWQGVRAKKEDAQPLAQELAEGLVYFGAFAGRGFLCALSRAQRLAEGYFR